SKAAHVPAAATRRHKTGIAQRHGGELLAGCGCPFPFGRLAGNWLLDDFMACSVRETSVLSWRSRLPLPRNASLPASADRTSTPRTAPESFRVDLYVSLATDVLGESFCSNPATVNRSFTKGK